MTGRDTESPLVLVLLRREQTLRPERPLEDLLDDRLLAPVVAAGGLAGLAGGGGSVPLHLDVAGAVVGVRGYPVAEDAVADRLRAPGAEDVKVRVMGLLEPEEAVLVPVWFAEDELFAGGEAC